MTTQEVAQLLATLQSDVYNGKINPVVSSHTAIDEMYIDLGDGITLVISGQAAHDLLNR